jgi:hypothetical protein
MNVSTFKPLLTILFPGIKKASSVVGWVVLLGAISVAVAMSQIWIGLAVVGLTVSLKLSGFLLRDRLRGQFEKRRRVIAGAMQEIRSGTYDAVALISRLQSLEPDFYMPSVIMSLLRSRA